MTQTADITRAAARLRGTPEEIAAQIAALIEGFPREPQGNLSFKERRLHREATASHWLEIFARRHWLTVEFGRRHGWKFRRDGHFTQTMLAERRKRRRQVDANHCGWTDHDHFFWDADGNPAAVVGHPYDVDPSSPHTGYRAMARKNGLVVSFPTDFPSWWYPGRTRLVLFEPAEGAGRRAAA